MSNPEETLEQAKVVLDDWKDWIKDSDIVEIQMEQGTHHKRHVGDPDFELGPNRKRSILIEINGGAEDTVELVNDILPSIGGPK